LKAEAVVAVLKSDPCVIKNFAWEPEPIDVVMARAGKVINIFRVFTSRLSVNESILLCIYKRYVVFFHNICVSSRLKTSSLSTSRFQITKMHERTEIALQEQMLDSQREI
jgi:hypothetical protein